MENKEQRKKCDICGGSGQYSFFKGVSRFLLSTEECAECAGTGYQLQGESRESESISSKPEKTKKVHPEERSNKVT
jgi:DnaJ-class molecular chaperone